MPAAARRLAGAGAHPERRRDHEPRRHCGRPTTADKRRQELQTAGQFTSELLNTSIEKSMVYQSVAETGLRGLTSPLKPRQHGALQILYCIDTA